MMRANDYDYDDDYEFSDMDDWDPAPDELGYDSEDDPLDKEWDEGDVPYDDEPGDSDYPSEEPRKPEPPAKPDKFKSPDEEDPFARGPFRVHDSLKLNPNPTKEQLHEIMRKYKEGSETDRKDATEEMLGILESYILNLITKKYFTFTKKHMDDLLGQAYYGAMKGMEGYDPDKGKPTTWFSKYILHELTAYTTQLSNNSQHYSNAWKKISECINKRAKRGLGYTETDIYLETGLPIKTIKKCLAMQEISTVSLYSSERYKEIPSDYNTDPQTQVMDKLRHEELNDMLFGNKDKKIKSILTKDERDVIWLVYGFGNEGRQSNKQIEALTGIPRHQVAKILASAQKKIKDEIERRNNPSAMPAREKVIEKQEKKQDYLFENILSFEEMEFVQITIADYFKEGFLN